MQVRSARAAAAFGAEPDIAAWADACALNPARVVAGRRDDADVRSAIARVGAAGGRGMTRLVEMAAAVGRSSPRTMST